MGYSEKPLKIAGKTYPGSEAYYHSQKPSPFDKALWEGDTGPGNGMRDTVMARAVREKFKDPELLLLLKATHPHPLVSIKPDAYWGIRPDGIGENMLAQLELNLRHELVDA